MLARLPWVKTVVDIPDPDNFEFVLKHGAGLGVDHRIVELAEKPDDLLLREPDSFRRSLRYAKDVDRLTGIKRDHAK